MSRVGFEPTNPAFEQAKTVPRLYSVQYLDSELEKIRKEEIEPNFRKSPGICLEGLRTSTEQNFSQDRKCPAEIITAHHEDILQKYYRSSQLRLVLLGQKDKSGVGAGFLRELRFPLPIYIPSALHNHLHYHPRLAQ
jgi:hypothetical protein